MPKDLASRASRLLAVASLVGATAAAPAGGLVVVSDSGSENTRAPRDDPGWANVGTVWSLTGTYLGNGWMLTASHVGAGPVVLGGRTFNAVPESTVQLRNSDGSLADVIVFRIQEAPHLPTLRIAKITPAVGTPVVLIGHGRNRGARLSSLGHEGFAWGTDSALRWGTNTVFKNDLRAATTEAFVTQFRKDGATPNEAQAALGDSGGPVFVKVQGKWRLAGVLIAVSALEKQPPETALYGNFTLIADLSRYRLQIEKLMAAPRERGRVKLKGNPPR